MAVIQILHLADVIYLRDVSPLFLMAFLKEKKMDKPDLLLVAGISETGCLDELAAVRIALEQIIRFLKLGPDKILIVANPADLAHGSEAFSTYVHKPLLGTIYDPQQPSMLHLRPHLQVFTLHTIPFQGTNGVTKKTFEKGLAAARNQTEGEVVPPSFLRAMFYYHPVIMCDESPTGLVRQACIHDHLRLAFFGETHAKMTRQCLYSIGVEAGMFHYFRYFPTRKKMVSTFGHLLGDRWQLGDSFETLLRRFQPVTIQE